MRKRNPLRGLIKFCILLVLILAMIYSGLQIMESTVLIPEEESTQTVGTKTIVRDGISYFPRQDITVMLVMGIDQSGPAQHSNYYRNEGSADSVMLLIFDETAQNCNVLYLNRDTMVNIETIGVRGEYAGLAYGQLGLAHTYGSGLEDSCENVKSTLLRMIHGLTIDYYVSMRLDAIPILNDAVGGVTVNIVDDFSDIDYRLTKGPVTLHGSQVLTFIQSRRYVGDQMNVTRMERHKEYVSSFLQAFRAKGDEDIDFIVNVYDQVSPYLVTDCSVTVLTNMMEKYAGYPLNEVVSPEGRNILGDEHYEFYLDEEKFDDLILRLFYAPK